MKNKDEKPSNKNTLIAAISITSMIIVLLIGVMFFAVPAIKKSKAINQADSLIAMEKFDDGIRIYESILSNGYSHDLMVKRDTAIELMESEEYYEMGIKASEDGDMMKAVKYLARVSQNDNKRYKKSLDELQGIEEVALVEVGGLIDIGDLSEAKKIVNEYLKILPDSIKMKRQINVINTQQSKIEQRAKVEAEEQKNKENAAAAEAQKAEIERKKKEEARNTANAIVGSYKSITSAEANLRDAPTLDSNVIGVLYRGATVYIYDTQVETSDRIWCLVDTDDYYYDTGWVSYNTINYSIK